MSDYQYPLGPETLAFDDDVLTDSQNRHSGFFFADLPPNLPTRSWQYRFLKRWIDIFGSLGLLTLSLVPCLAIAIVLAATTNEPIFYQEVRMGRGGRQFHILKFRSMRSCAPPQRDEQSSNLLQWRTQKVGYDPRITPAGKFLRQWSLDELPQLINVLRGDMSLVGPRPVVAAEIPFYGPMQHYYYAATPGLSGLWQVSGRSDLSFGARVDLDVTYVSKWSVWSDCKILWKTLPVVVSRSGAR